MMMSCDDGNVNNWIEGRRVGVTYWHVGGLSCCPALFGDGDLLVVLEFRKNHGGAFDDGGACSRAPLLDLGEPGSRGLKG
jgi:hypothetical protein